MQMSEEEIIEAKNVEGIFDELYYNEDQTELHMCTSWHLQGKALTGSGREDKVSVAPLPSKNIFRKVFSSSSSVLRRFTYPLDGSV